jgi:hypothetical protein
MASMKVAVTPELVERAVQRDSRHCMIAEAIKAQNPHFTKILVDLQTIRWSNPKTGKRYVCLTPEVAAAALVRFDQGEAIEPFDFSLKTTQITPTTTVAAKTGGHGPKTLDGQLTIHGGLPTRTGHLGGGSDVHAADRAAKREQAASPAPVSGDESNVKRSTSRYRQYGRRILQG